MERTNRKTKLSRQAVRREMKRVAHAGKPPVVIPVVVVAVDVDVPLIVPAVEGNGFHAKYRPFHHPLNTLEVESYPASQMP